MQSLSTYIALESLSNIKKNVFVKAIFTLTVIEIFLFESRFALSPTQQGTGKERAKVSAKKQKIIWILWKFLGK